MFLLVWLLFLFVCLLLQILTSAMQNLVNVERTLNVRTPLDPTVASANPGILETDLFATVTFAFLLFTKKILERVRQL